MVAGQSGLGKTTFLRTMFSEDISPPLETFDNVTMEFPKKTETITPYSFEFEADDGVRILIEAIDTPGFDDDVPAEARAKQLLEFVESTFQEFLEQELRIDRIQKREEHRIHALAYFIEPTGLGLKDCDAEFMKLLAGRVNIIPIVAKADSLTQPEMKAFKHQLFEDIRARGIDVFDFSKLESTDNLNHNSWPFSVIGATFPKASGKMGRAYPWGFVDINDSKNCDFNALKQNMLELFRDDLKEATEDVLYENYRTEQLQNKPPVA